MYGGDITINLRTRTLLGVKYGTGKNASGPPGLPGHGSEQTGGCGWRFQGSSGSRRVGLPLEIHLAVLDFSLRVLATLNWQSALNELFRAIFSNLR